MTDKIYHKFLILNGPNLNLLGVREPDIYGTHSLKMLEEKCYAFSRTNNIQLSCFQSNHEGELIDQIHKAYHEKTDGLIINAGALTHTSLALADALESTKIPTIEVHLSNIFQRETFRHHSYISLKAKAIICGLGINGYILALMALLNIVSDKQKA